MLKNKVFWALVILLGVATINSGPIAQAMEDIAETVYDSGIISPSETPTELELPLEMVATATYSQDKVVLRWEEFSEDGVQYLVFRKNQENEETQLTPEPIKVTTFRDFDVEALQTRYYLQVVDVDGKVLGKTPEVATELTTDVTPPEVPGNLQVEDVGTGKRIRINWSEVQDEDLVGYNLYRAEKGEWQKLNDEPLKVTNFEDTQVNNGTVYQYQVSSIDWIDNESDKSSSVEGWGTNQEARISWQFGQTGQEGSSDASLYAPHNADRTLGGTYLIADTQNSRVVEVGKNELVTWEYTGELIEPMRVRSVGSDEVLIVDGAGKVILVNKESKETQWSYGLGRNFKLKKRENLNNPQDALVLENGHILIADTGNGRLLEVNSAGNVVWSTDDKRFKMELNLPSSIQELPDKHLLITDMGDNRVIEVDRKGNIYWEYSPDPASPEGLDVPTVSLRLPNGNTLIVDSINYRILEVIKSGKVIWQFGERTNEPKLYEPSGVIWIEENNYIAVVDQHNHRLVEIDH